ncbi:MAG: D-aminoacyl-tRNA deacylase [Oscillospiraceae bacterium]|nr:D-aminoacyl-tRNA deacylase [Oscillospiraceae bacterium]MDD7354925.1 D-aminoacyl-tRNA deacylase [Oscillospiraceae bacterium]MDY3937233.1 D-aminoacyl-tRNA deacylase [Oscillospiraceae bacterium]
MKAVIQRVKSASVAVNGETVGSIGEGYMILLGVVEGDEKKHAEITAKKTASLRIFTDEDDKMNKSILDIGGEILVVSQFTLCADVKKGNRPSFINSAKPETANELYEYFMQCLKDNGVKKVEHGIFGEHMEVSLVNNGPVTILYDTDIWNV